MKLRLLTVALLAACVAPATAALAATSDGSSDSTQAFGAQERAWINLQTSGSASVAKVPPLPGEAADKIYQRWLDSFSHPIPESFKRETFVQGGGSSGR